MPGTGLPLVGQCSLEPSNVRLETECEESLPSGVGCRGPAPAGSRDTLRMMASAREKELKVKGRERGLIFLGLHRKPIKLLTRNLLCSQRPQVPSRWGENTGCPLPGEDTGHLPDQVLEAQAKKVNSEGPCAPRSHPERRREKEREKKKERKNDTGRPSFGEQGPQLYF